MSQTIHDILSLPSSLPVSERELLLSYVLKTTREMVFSHPEISLTPDQERLFHRLLSERLQGKPLAFIVGSKEFYGHSFLVNKNVLIPRPETELLVEEIITLTQKSDDASRPGIVDIGTGSGCIAITLALHTKNIPIMATDISREALLVAEKNAHLHAVTKNIVFFEGDLLAPLEDMPTIHTTTDHLIIVANLPYIPRTLYQKAPENPDTIGITYEPEIALVSGKDGLDHYRSLLAQIDTMSTILPSRIHIFAEYLGDDTQTSFFQSLAEKTFRHVTVDILPDLSGRNRFARVTLERIT